METKIEINENSIFLNGVEYIKKEQPTPKEAYAALIDKINGKNTWDSNPFVWVYDFEFINRS